ncbi:hybrid sensor histidine kinase/response regulator [Pseudoduganella umbonata]|uniref:histidine kinase n=1 Tax=Pseudoduganella umbonata TaxID=864828 RepID=A0A4P8HNM1_9BURK|nr:PAS domain-containing protein [Pseudoduganella umbonata]MBB3224319.1 PAS domain S-box-containing protein [Pseudoduganella umbonata]QCP11303.1 PAS domain S-box protein [Pseudoduganella umbonata]
MTAGSVALAHAHGYQPRGGGAVGDLVRAFDWAGTALGAPAAWTPALRTAVDIVLNSPIAMVLMWGPRHVMLYNDGYAEIAGARHPAALGGTVPDTWPEIWDWNRAILEAGMRGETQQHPAKQLTLMRNGVPEDVWFDLFYTPVYDTGGVVGGVLCTVVDVTRRVQQERAREHDRALLDRQNRSLRAESALLRELFEQAPGFMAVLRGPDHVFELANRPYQRLVGGRDVIGKPLDEALPEVRRQGIVDLLDRVYTSGEPYVGRQLKVDLLGDDGMLEPRYLDFVYQPLRAADGSVTGVFVEGVDITEHILTEERLRMAQQAGGIGSFEWFPASGKLVVSPEYRRVWGLTPDVEVTQELLVSLVDPRDRHRVGPERLAVDPNPLAYAEYRIRRPDTGEVRWLARQGEAVEGATPAQRRYVGVAFDITGRKRIEQQLRTSQDRLAAIFGQASVGLSELSLEGRYTRVNGALCQMLGRPEEALLGLHMEDLIHPDDLAENRAQVARLVDTGIPFTLEKRYARPDGEWVWIASSMSRLDDEAGQPVALIAVKTDITERRRIEVALRDLNDTLEQRVSREVAERDKAEEALRQAQKMEAVGQLTGGVAHDFNNVLQIISGNLHLLAQQLGGDDAVRRRLDMAIAAVERGAKLSSQLLAFARRQPLQPVVTDLGRLVSNMDELLRRALGEAVDLLTVVGSGLWNTLVDPGQIENVILNLAINARDAMQGAGRLTIELGNAVLDDHYVSKLADVPAGQYVMLSVTDTGCGMTPEVLQRAFEPFFTTKPEGEGTGLGLSMAYGFVKQSRGHIRIASEPGQGTSVKIYLPRTLLAETADAGPQDGPVTGGTETILAVEDDEGVRNVVLDMLSALGYRVLAAENGEQALRIIESGEQVDLLFTDVVMPGPLRSPELARIAQQVLPNLAVLFTSGYPQDAIVHGGRLDAGLELLSKPYRREDLARKLRHVLNNRRQQIQARERQHAPQHNLLEPQPQHPQHASLRVLVVEDNQDSLQMVCELVGMLGHTVSGVGDGESAWQLMQSQEFDVLFTDVSLPGMSGIELARKVAREKAMRIIFSTGYGKEALEHLEFEAACLRKPYDLMDLQAALDDVPRHV